MTYVLSSYEKYISFFLFLKFSWNVRPMIFYKSKAEKGTSLHPSGQDSHLSMPGCGSTPGRGTRIPHAIHHRRKNKINLWQRKFKQLIIFTNKLILENTNHHYKSRSSPCLSLLKGICLIESLVKQREKKSQVKFCI